MKHYGDITKLNGGNVPPVSIITGGSPCQDLSVAGKRAGLDGERSGLFMEQIRVIKEMRENDRNKGRTDEFIRPRYMVWENVPGALSSNGGEDFRVVLEETARVADENAVVPGLEGGEKWTPSGCILGDGWSIAWRIHDAQFWGVPQRRKRIALVADFGGFTAPEILFERKGMSGDIESSATQGQEVAGAVGNGIAQASGVVSKGNGEVFSTYEKHTSLSVGGGQTGQGYPCVAYGFDPGATRDVGVLFLEERSKTLSNGSCPGHHNGVVCSIENHPADSRVKVSKDGIVQTFSSRMGTGGGNVPMVMEPISFGNGQLHDAMSPSIGVAKTLNCMVDPAKIVIDAVCIGNGQVAQTRISEKVGTLNCMHDQQAIITLQSSADHNSNSNNVCRQNSVVRRLTPLECERLQGFPDRWTDIGDWIDSKGKKHKGDSDSPRYKALGNSIALPFWEWMAKRMAAYLPEGSTMASLFDGIGGFPLAYQRAGIRPIWASEIEEFPIAVTKARFPDDE